MACEKLRDVNKDDDSQWEVKKTYIQWLRIMKKFIYNGRLSDVKKDKYDERLPDANKPGNVMRDKFSEKLWGMKKNKYEKRL